MTWHSSYDKLHPMLMALCCWLTSIRKPRHLLLKIKIGLGEVCNYPWISLDRHVPSPCKQSTSPAMELLQFSWSIVWEYFGAAFSKHNSFLSSYRSGLRKDCNNWRWECHEPYLEWESEDAIAHRSATLSAGHSSDSRHHTAFYSYRMPFCSPLRDTNWYFIPLLHLWHEKGDSKTEWTLISGKSWDISILNNVFLHCIHLYKYIRCRNLYLYIIYAGKSNKMLAISPAAV